jgi:hypothetical protein
MKTAMIHALTGTRMYVEQDRVDEYLRAGHRLAPEETQVETPAAKRQRAKKAKE